MIRRKILHVGAAPVPPRGGAAADESNNDPSRLDIKSVPALDAAVEGDSGVYVTRVEGSGPVQIALFSSGVLATLSQDPQMHGFYVSFPPPEKTVEVFRAERAAQKRRKEIEERKQAREQQRRAAAEDAVDEEEDDDIASPSTPAVARPRTFIIDAAAGESHYAACDSQGRVFTWGFSNAYGQLGHGPLFTMRQDLIGVHEPVALSQFGPAPIRECDTDPESEAAASEASPNTVIEAKMPHRIIAVACGRDHTVLLSETRKCVFVFGRGHRGQLGLKDTAPSSASTATVVVDFAPTPRSVPALFGLPIAQISCSSSAHHTLVVLQSGHLISMGENASGNLGVIENNKQHKTTHDHDDEYAAAKKSTARAQHPHCYVPCIVDIPSTSEEEEEQQDEKNMKAAGAVSFPQFPRRMKPLVPLAKQQHPPPVPVAFVHSSALHTAAIDMKGRLFTAGTPPLRLQNGSQPVGALGPLGRTVGSAAESAHFGAVPEFFIDVAAGDAVVCGAGFTAVLLARHNSVFVSGGVQAKSGSADVCVGAGVEAESWLQLDTRALGPSAAVRQIFAAGKGLLLVVDECPESK